MKKFIILAALYSSCVYPQDEAILYKGLYFQMPIKEAKKEFRENKAEYQIISFGNGVEWQMAPINFFEKDGLLIGITLVPRNAPYGLTHDSAELYLSQSLDFFEDKGYVVFYSPDNWNVPILFDSTNKYGLLMHDKGKRIAISLRSNPMTNETARHLPTLSIDNYENVIKAMERDDQEVIDARKSTGF